MKKVAIEIKWAILFAVIQLVWMFGERIAGLHDENIAKHSFVTNFFAIVAIAFYVVALLDKRKNDFNGKMTWIQGFISGLIITLGVTILTPLTQYLTVEVITPHYFENMIRYAVENGLQTQEEAEGYFNLRSYMTESVMTAPIMGLLPQQLLPSSPEKNKEICRVQKQLTNIF